VYSEGKHDKNTVGAVNDGDIRLNHFIASCGFCSRREADKLIEQGAVTVNGRTAAAGEKISADGKDIVRVRDQILKRADQKAVVAYYKPVGVTCTEKDPHAARTLSESFHYPIRLTYAGRLDRDSEGLLLMTNDGKLIDRMMRSANGHEKEYIVRVTKHVSDADINRLRKGVFLKELKTVTKPCVIVRLGDHTFRVILTQGLNNQIRRMFRLIGAEVKRLKRVRVLNVELGAMQPGQMREIRGEELQDLYHAAGMDGK
jgi:23S rRNA pseudouridine2604 synthase